MKNSTNKNFVIHYALDLSKGKTVTKRLAAVTEVEAINFLDLVSKLKESMTTAELESVSKIYID